ncbi:hypothetical protein DEALK_04110 [Dehalogenimonas alkenigignens]|uniref:DUF559 domain-containing protein n=1 Tax=Dehalogenimonas alkenigignens TaxID=1217799 RepID=A0A0W0GG94_9CHLR|nr:DUF559 domain-containing protein [Dehalogenimonas alkenigignens]KTB47566.1 hypothetical protein DEALK_04110 [Dehalogenimonas alkenigignens]
MPYLNKKLARDLRKSQTEAEKLLWSKINSRQLDGIKFRHQRLIGDYIVDFVSLTHRLIIELDGEHHNALADIDSDNRRTEQLQRMGYSVIRFWNNDVLKNCDGVVHVIQDELSRITHSEDVKITPSPCPLPSGDGRGDSLPALPESI